MSSTRLLAGASAALLYSGVALADPTSLLVNAAAAARTANYQGVIIYRDEGHLEALRVVHRFDGTERERVTSLNGDPREVFRENDQVVLVLPKEQTMRVGLPPPPVKALLSQMTPERIATLKSWYDFKDLGPSRVASRPCTGVAILPHDQFRYGYELWSDDETHIPVKISLVDFKGAVLEQLMFSEISFPDRIPDEAFTPTGNTARSDLVSRTDPAPLPVESLDDSGAGFTFGKLPEGFHVVMRMTHGGTGVNGVVEHTVLSDGLAAVSVFTRPQSDGQEPFRGGAHLNSVVHIYRRTVDGSIATVVGEVPHATVRMIGDGMQMAPSPAPAGSVGTDAGGAHL